MIDVNVTEIVSLSFGIFFAGLCAGLFFGILSRALSAVAGIIKHLIT